MGFEGLECLGLQVKALLPNPGLEFVAFMSSADVAETVQKRVGVFGIISVVYVCVCVWGACKPRGFSDLVTWLFAHCKDAAGLRTLPCWRYLF